MSQSIDLQLASEQLDQIDVWLQSLRAGDSWSLYIVGAGVRQFESIEALRTTLEKWQSGLADDSFRSGSHLAEGMLTTRLSFPAGKSRRIVLISDGRETREQIGTVLKQLAEEGIDVRLRSIEGLGHAEAAIASLAPASREAYSGEVMRLEAELASNREMTAQLQIVHKGVVVQKKEVQLQPDQKNLAYFDVDLTTSGHSQWTAELIPAEDHFPVNNRATCTINVRGRPRVLVLHEKPQEMRQFSRAMREQQMEIEIRGEHGLPETLSGMGAFDAIVLADLPATALSPRQMQMVKQYVTDLGGGLVMLGSENSFGLGGYYKTPVEDVLPLVSRFEKEKEKPSLGMVLVIDKSGSMNGVPIALARQAAKAAVELLSPRDSIAVVGFDSQAQIICEMTSASDVDSIQAAIDSLQAGGGTYMYPAMVAAKEMLESTPAKIRHMICLSDGHTQPADHQSLAEEMAEQGITVSTVALGQADKQLLAQIAEVGRGRYYETDDPGNVPQIFTKETMQATKSAIKEDLYGSVQLADHAVLAGYNDAELPFTLGYVMTEAKPTAQLLLAVETGDPLLAIGRYGLGVGMAYTSDLAERWGGEWLNWDGCGKFWAQALRGVLRKSSVDGFQIASRQDELEWGLEIRRTGRDGQPVNGIRWDAAMLVEGARTQPTDVREVGLGRYEVQAPLDRSDRLTLRLHDVDYDKTRVMHFHRPYPQEYRLGQAMPEALAQLKQVDAHSLVDDIVPQRRRRSIAHWTYFAALGCALASVLLRRV